MVRISLPSLTPPYERRPRQIWSHVFPLHKYTVGRHPRIVDDSVHADLVLHQVSAINRVFSYELESPVD